MTRPRRPAVLDRAATHLERARAVARRAARHRLGVRARLAALEAEVQENRALNRRVAELTDVVAELLVPLHARDEEKVAEALETYRRSI